MSSTPVHRSETLKEVDDQQYLSRLTRMQTQAARLENRASAPVHVPERHQDYHRAHSKPFAALPLITTQPPVSDSPAILNTGSTISMDAYFFPPHFLAPLPSSPSPMQTHENTQTNTRLFPSLMPSRSSSPAPPSIPELTDMVDGPVGDWRSSSSTMTSANFLDNPRNGDRIDDHHNGVQVQSHRHSIYGDNTSYDYGMPVNYRTGASQDPETLSGLWKSEFEEHPEMRQEASASEKSGRGPTSQPSYPSLEHSDSRSPQSLQDAHMAHQQRTGGFPKREQMLKRSTQLYPVHFGEGRKGEGQGNEHPWQSKWKPSSQLKYGKRVSSLTVVGPDNSGSWNNTASPLSEEKRAQLQELFDKKKTLQRPASEKDARSSVDGSLSALHDVDLPKRGFHGGNGSRGKRWWHESSGCVPLGMMIGFICLFMFAYNGILSLVVFQASRFPSNTNLPVFIFGLLFIFTTALSLFGLMTSISLSRSNSNLNPGRAPHLFFKAFHVLYLCTSVLTFGCMVGWLGLNFLQTGSWDRMYLKNLNGLDSSAYLLTFESLLQPDMTNPDWRIINPWVWIAAFVVIWLVQVYFWVCLVALGRRPRAWERIDDEREEKVVEEVHMRREQ
ncbi:hypothetical protein EDD21DRAFT_382906 [Dissophora ornata]|nr:hypothetical protein EDD21DRAFT_382906 [Dissophora ornata]